LRKKEGRKKLDPGKKKLEKEKIEQKEKANCTHKKKTTD